MKRTHKLTLAIAVASATILALVAAAFQARTSSQRQAISALTEIGIDATRRNGGRECWPGFAFDQQGPPLVADLATPEYFGNVTEVWFDAFDDQQLIESIPYLQQFPRLTHIGFRKPLPQPTLDKMRTALPGVAFVDSFGKRLP